MNKQEAVDTIKILQSLIDIGDASIILNTFISAFNDKQIIDSNGQVFLQGNFNVTGTKSTRMSSSKVNLQNLPSTGSRYAKIIKQCFQYCINDEWIICGADFSSLEAKINALLTKDPEKLKIYIDGFDAHSFNAYHYWPDKFKNIKQIIPKTDADIKYNVEQINSIQHHPIYKKYRQDSKKVTFAAQYGGTSKTFVNSSGFTLKEAKKIEENYHKLYVVSDQWAENRMREAAKVGYIDIAFGSRLRVPVLNQVIYGSTSVPYEALAEKRTAINASQQSYGMLNNRAAIELQNRLFKTKHIYDIKPIAHIHDAQYFLVKRKPEVIKWLNDNLVKCMEWQELPEIKHDKVKLGGSLCIYHKTWNDEIELPKYTDLNTITNILNGL